MMPADYELDDVDYTNLVDIDRFQNFARDQGLLHHLEEGRETYLPLERCFRADWQKLINPVGWYTYTHDPKHDVAVNQWGVVGEAREWIADRGAKHSLHFHAKEVEGGAGAGLGIYSPNGTLRVRFGASGYSIQVGYVVRFRDQGDATLFKMLFSDRVGA